MYCNNAGGQQNLDSEPDHQATHLQNTTDTKTRPADADAVPTLKGTAPDLGDHIP